MQTAAEKRLPKTLKNMWNARKEDGKNNIVIRGMEEEVVTRLVVEIFGRCIKGK